MYLEIYLCMNPTPPGQAWNSSTLLVTRGAYVLPFPFSKCHQNCHLGRSLYYLSYHHVVTSSTPNIFSFSTYMTAVTPFTAFIEEPHQFESTQCASTQPQKREASQKFEVCHDYGPKRDSKGMTRNIYQTTRHKADKMVKVLFTLCQYTIPLLFHVLKLYWPAVQDLLLPSLCPQAPSCWNICQCFLVYVSRPRIPMRQSTKCQNQRGEHLRQRKVRLAQLPLNDLTLQTVMLIRFDMSGQAYRTRPRQLWLGLLIIKHEKIWQALRHFLAKNFPNLNCI